MNSAFVSCPENGDERFTRTDVSADAVTAAWTRDEFTQWLRRRTGLDPTRVCDVVLAVNEALANSVEFAYLDGGDGTVDVEAVRDVRRCTLTVTVSDRGHWRETDPLNRQRCRGRGIPLMRTFADSVIIDTSGLGTSVAMRFDDVHAPRPVEVAAYRARLPIISR